MENCVNFSTKTASKNIKILLSAQNRTQVTLQLKMQLIIFDKTSHRCSGTKSHSNGKKTVFSIHE